MIIEMKQLTAIKSRRDDMIIGKILLTVIKSRRDEMIIEMT